MEATIQITGEIVWRGVEPVDGVLHLRPDNLPLEERVQVILEKGERMANPASTKHLIYGPAKITAFLWRDGGLDLTIE
jgi:hypothetical protein